MKSYPFQIKDEIKAARIEATRRTDQYVEEPGPYEQDSSLAELFSA
jgi:hypothetical protein